MQADAEIQDADLPVGGEGTEETETKADAKKPSTEDWKAKYEGSETARAKAENDLKALRGLRMTEQQREERMAAIADRLETIDQQQVALIKALGNNTTEELPGEVARLQEASQHTQAARRFTAQYQSLYEDFQGAVLDTEGAPILELDKAPELAEARATW